LEMVKTNEERLAQRQKLYNLLGDLPCRASAISVTKIAEEEHQTFLLDLIDSHGLDEHGIYYYVPSLLKHFTAAQINALIAPRPHLALAGNDDRLTPVNGLERIDEELKKVYHLEQAEDAWQLKRYDCGHLETAAMRDEVLAFLDKWL
jgi:hypothetical protein